MVGLSSSSVDRLADLVSVTHVACLLRDQVGEHAVHRCRLVERRVPRGWSISPSLSTSPASRQGVACQPLGAREIIEPRPREA